MRKRQLGSTGLLVGLATFVVSLGLAVHGPELIAQSSQQQARPSSQEPIFRSGVELVALTVTVEQPDGTYVTDLARERFRIFDEGVQRDVAFFGVSEVPIDLVLLIDTSASMTNRLATTARAATNFVNALRPGDRAAVMNFGTRTSLRVPFTLDRTELEQGISGLRAGDSTALYNAIYVALKEFGGSGRESGDIRRRAIVLLSDGEDTASLISFDSVIEQARRLGVAVYTIFMTSPEVPGSSDRRFSSAGYEMRSLARETGARSFFPTSIDDLDGVYASIARELSQQYSLAFVPDASVHNGRFRRVSVTVDHPNAKVRTRTGYIAAAPSHAASRHGEAN
jgi:Ca-activated chloride channel family protein